MPMTRPRTLPVGWSRSVRALAVRAALVRPMARWTRRPKLEPDGGSGGANIQNAGSVTVDAATNAAATRLILISGGTLTLPATNFSTTTARSISRATAARWRPTARSLAPLAPITLIGSAGVTVGHAVDTTTGAVVLSSAGAIAVNNTLSTTGWVDDHDQREHGRGGCGRIHARGVPDFLWGQWCERGEDHGPMTMRRARARRSSMTSRWLRVAALR